MKYWAYKHTNGGIHLKIYREGLLYGRTSIDDAYDSSSVDDVLEPFEAESREEAEQFARRRLNTGIGAMPLQGLPNEPERWVSHFDGHHRKGEPCNQCNAPEQPVPETGEREDIELTMPSILRDLEAWLSFRLECCIRHKAGTMAPTYTDGYSYVEIPEWEARQKLDNVRAARNAINKEPTK